MLISKFDLYRNEWLDLVFENRNKEYGAYNLRQDYAGNMIRAMIITFGGLSILLMSSFFFKHAQTITKKNRDTVIVVNITPPLVNPPEKKVEPLAKPKVEPPAKLITTIKNPVMVVTVDKLASDPIKNVDIKGAIGPVNSKGTDIDDNIAIEEPKTTGGGTGVVDNTVHADFDLDVMPAPIGGESAWAKFLNRNLRYPGEAQDEQVSGKVFLSFIIEKDGSLSNISVVRPAGHGFDEEAMRVLKLAKAWKPGMQNGQAVRVKYTIPINFQLTDNN